MLIIQTRSTQLILASGSPRRRDLMTEAGYVFDIVAPNVDEMHDEATNLRELTRLNAIAKARAGAEMVVGQAIVIGADTLVAIDDCALGKPANHAAALDMLGRLAGRTHDVCTAVALIEQGGTEEVFLAVTRVTFKYLSRHEIATYLTMIDPLDKAGGYAAQEHGDFIIEKVEGSWTNVVGLPMDELAVALARRGIVTMKSKKV